MRDLKRLERIYRLFMKELGLDTKSVHTRDTPKRVSKMFRDEFTIGGGDLGFNLSTFPYSGDQYIAIHKIPFSSLCCHHHLPFVGEVDIVYYPNKELLGLSKFARIVKYLSSKPNIQEKLTEEIADYIYNYTWARGIYVRLRGTHYCMKVRGVFSGGVTTTAVKRGSIVVNEALTLINEKC